MENCNTVKKVVLNFTDVSSLGPSSLLLRRRAKARNVSKVKLLLFYGVTIFHLLITQRLIQLEIIHFDQNTQNPDEQE